jgi:hypothetical protein
MMRIAITGGAVLALTVALAGASLPPAPVSASSRPVLYNPPLGPPSNFRNPQIRPVGRTLVLVEDGEWLLMRRWSRWTSTNAYGSGTLYSVRHPPHEKLFSGPVRLHLYRVETHKGTQYFTRIRLTLPHKIDQQGSETLSFHPRFQPAWAY